MSIPRLTIIVVTYNSGAEIEACLRSVTRTIKTLSFEVIVVDNASQDDTVDRVRGSFPDIVIVQNSHNVGFPAANNQALRLAHGEYALLLNPDTVVHEGAVEQLVAALERNPEVGVCGPQLVDAEGVPANDLRLPTFFRIVVNTLGLEVFTARLLRPECQEAVSGAALTFRRSLVAEIGLLDEHMFWAEDGDFCLRAAEAGYRIWRVQSAVITHYVGRSTNSNLALYLKMQYASRIRFLWKHGRPVEFWLALPLFYFSLTMRVSKWCLQSVLRPSVEASIRVRSFLCLLVNMPTLFADEARRTRRLGLGDKGADCSGASQA